MNVTGARIRLAIIALSAVAFLFFAIQDASKGSDPIEGLLFEFAIYGIPLVVFAFVVWSSRWRELTSGEGAITLRSRIGLAAEVMAGLSAALFLLTLPFTAAIAEHESLGMSWIFTGFVTAILGVIGAVAGLPRRWLHAIACALLVPCWFFLAALFVKMMMD